MAQRLSQLASELWPFLLPKVGAMVQGAGGGGGVSGGGAVGLHDLAGSLHKGTLADAQAPQFLLRNGTRSLSGSLAVDAGITIDGVDISAHAADPNAHHAMATAGVGISVTGQQIGLAAGSTYQFIGTGSGTSAGWRNVSELAGVGLSVTAGVLAVGVANTGAAGLSVEADLVRLTSSSNPGAAASVLATDASGYLSLVRLSATDRLRSPLLDTAAGALTISPATDVLLQPASNLVKAQAGVALQAYNYASQTTGWRITQDGQGDFRYLFTDEMHAKSFIADLEQALAGGQLICKSVAVLASTFTAPIITFRAKASGTSATTSLLVSKPTGTVQYDVMVAAIIHSASTSVSAAPAGWTLLLSRTQGTTVLRVYWKPAGAAEGTDYTWTLANSGRSLGTIYSFVNVDNAAPIDASGSQGNVSSTSVTAPTITTLTQGTRLLFLAGFYDANVTGAAATPPTNYSELEDTTGGTNTWSYGADFFYVGPGATGPQTATLATAHLSAAAMIALKPTASPVTTITVRDLPSAEHMQVFQAGDIIRVRQFSRSGGSLDITNCWGTVSSPVDNNDKTQTWTFTRSAAPYAGAMWPGAQIAPDAIILDYGISGNGFYEVNAIDGLYGANSPYWQVVTWATHPATGQTVRARGGNLYGIFAQANEYGLFAGGGTANTDSYLRISNAAVRLNNVPLQLWNGANQTVNISSTGTDVWIGPSSADKRLTWDGSTLTVKGAITVQAGSNVAAGATVGATWGTDLNSIPSRFGNSPGAAGLYLTASNMGYWDGANWKTWMASTGQFYFGGSTGASLRWDGTKLSGYDSLNAEQWKADASDGKLYAGGTNVRLASDGVRLLMSDTANGYNELKWAYSHTSTPEFRILSIRNADNTVTSTISTQAQTAGKSATLYIAAYKQDATFGSIVLLGNVSVGGTLSSGTLSTGGGYYSDNTHTFYNLAGSAYQNITVQNMSLSGGNIYSNNAYQFLTGAGAAQVVRAYSYLASSDYGHASRVPATGIYTLGGAAFATSDGLTSGYMLDVGGPSRFRASIAVNAHINLTPIAAPAASGVTGILYVNSSDNRLHYIKPGGGDSAISP